MALFRGIQEYIALDANNITLVFDSGNIVNISGNIFLYPPQGRPILYNCAFVDFTQAFDRIEHGLLWFKLFDAGVITRMCNAIKAMYKKVKSLVKCNNVMSESFESLQGVKDF